MEGGGELLWRTDENSKECQLGS